MKDIKFIFISLAVVFALGFGFCWLVKPSKSSPSGYTEQQVREAVSHAIDSINGQWSDSLKIVIRHIGKTTTTTGSGEPVIVEVDYTDSLNYQGWIAWTEELKKHRVDTVETTETNIQVYEPPAFGAGVMLGYSRSFGGSMQSINAKAPLRYHSLYVMPGVGYDWEQKEPTAEIAIGFIK